MSTGILRLVAAGVLCAASLGLSGCIVVSEDKQDARPPTVGRELMDLKQARDEGALEPEQYHAARDKVLARLDKPKPCK